MARFTACRALFLLLVGASCACGGSPSEPEPEVCDIPEVEIEWGRMTGGMFRPFRDGDRAPITLGFQGFRFIRSAVAFNNLDADKASFKFQVHVESREPTVQEASSKLLRGPPGVSYAEEVLVFFNDVPIAELVGRDASVLAVGKTRGCTGSHTVTVELVNDDSCPDGGGTECNDAGAL